MALSSGERARHRTPTSGRGMAHTGCPSLSSGASAGTQTSPLTRFRKSRRRPPQTERPQGSGNNRPSPPPNRPRSCTRTSKTGRPHSVHQRDFKMSVRRPAPAQKAERKKANKTRPRPKGRVPARRSVQRKAPTKQIARGPAPHSTPKHAR